MQYKQYRLKFYLNLRHYIYINGKKGQLHPHTWELCLNVLKTVDEFILFHQMEEEMNAFLQTYQDQILNEIEPFHRINPTLENCCDYMAEQLGKILNKLGYILLMVEISETPAKSYVISYLNHDASREEQMMDIYTDTILKEIKKRNKIHKNMEKV